MLQCYLWLQVLPCAACPRCATWTCPVTEVWLEAWVDSPLTCLTWLTWRAWTSTCAASNAPTWRFWVSLCDRHTQQPLQASPPASLQSRCCLPWRRWRRSTFRPIRRREARSTSWCRCCRWLRWGGCRWAAAGWRRSPSPPWVNTDRLTASAAGGDEPRSQPGVGTASQMLAALTLTRYNRVVFSGN